MVQLGDQPNRYQRFLKPSLDRFTALLILLISSPMLLPVILFLSFANKGSAFFVQERPGKNLKRFKLIKFKTMTDDVDAAGLLLPDRDRLTRIGRLVRKTSLDELPQLINVILGDMSIIGPRPLLEEYIPIYSPFQLRRHEVLPGITGWAQVNGRNSISWQEKFALDLFYVENISMKLDLRILLMTIVRVVKAQGISGRGVATAEKFNGHN